MIIITKILDKTERWSLERVLKLVSSSSNRVLLCKHAAPNVASPVLFSEPRPVSITRYSVHVNLCFWKQHRNGTNRIIDTNMRAYTVDRRTIKTRAHARPGTWSLTSRRMQQITFELASDLTLTFSITADTQQFCYYVQFCTPIPVHIAAVATEFNVSSTCNTQ